MMPFWDRKHRAAANHQASAQVQTPDAQQQMGDRIGRRTGHSLRHFLRSLKRSKKRASQYEHKELSNGKLLEPSSPEEPQSASPPMLRQTISPAKSHDVPNVKPTDRPLPPTPVEVDTKSEQGPAILHDEDVQALYRGAPQFKLGTVNGKPKVTVSYPWDGKSHAAQVANDCPPLPHPAFSAATLHEYPPRATATVPVDKDPEQDPEVIEVPNMLSAQGSELGTVGFEYFLELPLSDSNITDNEDDQAKNGLSEAARNRELFHATPEKLGFRRFDMAMVNERLVEISEMFQSTRENRTSRSVPDIGSAGELYATLFGKFLAPPRFDPNAGDPTGLKVQIETLLKTLKLKGLWYNFSLVEWRIRLGQLLWTVNDPAWSDDEAAGDGEWQWNDRNLLLLQLLLSCELFLRLNAASSEQDKNVDQQLFLTVDEMKVIDSLRTPKTNWDAILAKRFLYEIQVAEEAPLPPTPKRKGFFSAISSESDEVPPQKRDIVFLARNQARQLSGLAFFAAAIGWPNIDTLFGELSNRLDLPDLGHTSSNGDPLAVPTAVTVTSIYATPLATPRSTSVRSSYFTSSPAARPFLSRTSTQRSIQLRPSSVGSDSKLPTNPANIGGWLSRTYMTGLILPGEAICHLLISTLLENDAIAISALGESANLYGGFAYEGCSWWSNTCVVGKVLAATEEAKECMGWIMVKCIPEDWADGWIDISSNTVKLENRLKRDDAFTSSNIVKGESDFGNIVKGESDFGNIKADDFKLPLDRDQNPVTEDTEVRFLGLHLEPTKEVHFKVPAEESTSNGTFPTDEDQDHENSVYNATVRFLVPSSAPEDINPDLVDHGDAPDPATDSSDPHVHSLNLRNDVYFVSAYPCTPPPSTNKSLFETFEEEAKVACVEAERLPAHPLHASHLYRTIPASALVNPDADVTAIGAAVRNEDDGVLMIDATTSTDASVLARAWCSEKGLNALIARRGRSCLSCAVREANGLALKIIIRV